MQTVEALEQRPRQCAGPAPDLDHGVRALGRDRVDEPANHRRIVKEMLAETLLGAHRRAQRGGELARELDRGEQAVGASASRARESQRGAVIHGRTDDRQAERHVDDLAERERLERGQPLIVIHREHEVGVRERVRRERRVGRHRPRRS